MRVSPKNTQVESSVKWEQLMKGMQFRERKVDSLKKSIKIQQRNSS